MADIFSADLPQMQDWARGLMASRPPDFVIGDNYLRRWWVIPRNPFCNVYLHEIRKSDDDRALHDHPWANTSVVISGGYAEIMPGGETRWRGEGSVVERRAEDLHRLLIVPEMAQRAISLFMTGPKVREWGFACPQGWVHWRDFTDPDDPGQRGRGCGEYEIPEAGVASAASGAGVEEHSREGRPCGFAGRDTDAPTAATDPYPFRNHRTVAETWKEGE